MNRTGVPLLGEQGGGEKCRPCLCWLNSQSPLIGQNGSAPLPQAGCGQCQGLRDKGGGNRPQLSGCGPGGPKLGKHTRALFHPPHPPLVPSAAKNCMRLQSAAIRRLGWAGSGDQDVNQQAVGGHMAGGLYSPFLPPSFLTAAA